MLSSSQVPLTFSDSFPVLTCECPPVCECPLLARSDSFTYSHPGSCCPSLPTLFPPQTLSFHVLTCPSVFTKVSAPRSLGFFLCPDSSVRLCSPALALAHLDPFCVLPCLSVRASGGKCIAHSDSFRVLTRPSICALQPLPLLTWILSVSSLVPLSDNDDDNYNNIDNSNNNNQQ